MHIIRNDTTPITDAAIRQLVQQRISDLEAFETGILGYFLIVEPGDTLNALNAQIGFSIIANRFTGIRFDRPGFTPSFEFIEDTGCCYDMVFILSDDGFGIEVFVPKTDGIDPDLIAMCIQYAIPKP